MPPALVYVALQRFGDGDERPRRLLREAGFTLKENTLGRRLRLEEVPAEVAEADAVLAGLEPYTAEVFAALPRLQCISRCGIGTDAIDVEAARVRGIAVYTTPDEVTAPVAELTVGLMLALARHLPLHAEGLRAGRWHRRQGRLLSEWTIGLVGFGRIGRAVARALQPFGPAILATDPAAHPADMPQEIELTDLATLLAQADLVSLHASPAPGTQALLGARELALMKPGSYLVNTARGSLVDEAALEQALASGRLAGAALDVFAQEPYAGPLTRLPNVFCTPHVGSLTRASRAAMEWRCAQHVIEHFKRRPLRASGAVAR